MKQAILGTLILFVSMGLNAFATLEDENGVLQGESRDLEKRCADLERQRQEKETQLQETRHDFLSCTNGPFQIILQPRVNEAEKQRKDLEAERVTLQGRNDTLSKVNLNLEKSRIDLEARRSDGRITESEYAAEFRKYMAEWRETYKRPINQEVFSGYEQYLTGIQNYLDFVKTSHELCNDVSSGKLTLDDVSMLVTDNTKPILSFIGGISDAVSNLRNIFSKKP